MRETLEKINKVNAEEAGLVEGGVPYSEVREAIRNPENFVHRIESASEIISPGVSLDSKTLELGDGNFSNVFDLHFNSTDESLDTRVVTRHFPIYADKFISQESTKSKKPIACLNGAFYFLVDEQLENPPSEIIFNLNIRDGKVFGLPAVDRSALIANNQGKIEARQIKARGVVAIKGIEISWVGGEGLAHKKAGFENLKASLGQSILFNSACCTVEYEDKNDKKSLRKVRKDLNQTPKQENVTDVVVSVTEQGEAKVSKVRPGGGSDFFEGNFILQMTKEEAANITTGDLVDLKNIDGLDIKQISSAMTTGPEIKHFLTNDDHEMNHDLSNGSFPPFDPKARYARSIMYEDSAGQTHMVVFDAVPRSEKMKGVTPKEVAEFLPKDIKWGIFLDGGQSSRITFQSQPNPGEVRARGNSQYVRLHILDKKSQAVGGDERFLWTGRGRPISSMIVLDRKNL